MPNHSRYPGAQPFSDSIISEKIFFGRQHESEELADKIMASRLVVLYAKSGMGKTSLINAGVSPILRKEMYVPLTVRVNDTTKGICESIYEKISYIASEKSLEHSDGINKSLWLYFKTVEFWQDDIMLTPVLILDQFEEIFTIQKPDIREAFLAELGALVRGVSPDNTMHNDEINSKKINDKPPVLRIVISLREDYLGFLEEASDRIPQIFDHRFRLNLLSTDAARLAIVSPAMIEDEQMIAKPFKYDEKLTNLIIEFLSTRKEYKNKYSCIVDYIEPFQLQLICEKIEQIAISKQADDRTPIIGLNDIGGDTVLQKIISDFYTNIVSSIKSYGQRHKVNRLCRDFLISTTGNRLSIEEHEIVSLLKVSSTTLQYLVEKRLLRSDQRTESTYYELSHDTLVNSIMSSNRFSSCLISGIKLSVSLILLLIALVLAVFFFDAAPKNELTENLILFIIGSAILIPMFYMGILAIKRNWHHYRKYRISQKKKHLNKNKKQYK